MFCCTLLYVHSSFAIILKVKRKLVALLSLSSLRLLIDVWLFLMVPYVCLQFVIVVFPDHTHLLLLTPGDRHILLLANKLSSIFRFHYTVMQFPIYFEVRNTQVISTGQLLGHQSTLIPVQNLGETKQAVIIGLGGRRSNILQ